jgi:protein involved in polysaccharide export with SLBB domain
VKELRASIAALQKESANVIGGGRLHTNAQLAELIARRGELSERLEKSERDDAKARLALHRFSTNEVEFARLQSEYGALAATRDELIRSRVRFETKSAEQFRPSGHIETARVMDVARMRKFGLAGSALGLCLGTTALAVGSRRRRFIRSPALLSEATGLPTLATLPDIQHMDEAAREYWAIETLEQIRKTAGVSRHDCFVCGFVSASSGEGCSTWIDLLAMAGLRSGNRVLVISRPQHWSHALAGGAPADQAVVDLFSHRLFAPEETTHGSPAIARYTLAGAAEPYLRKRWDRAFTDWRDEQDALVLVELPYASTADALALSPSVPHVVWLASANSTRTRAVSERVASLKKTGCNFIGCVLNRVSAIAAAVIGGWILVSGFSASAASEEKVASGVTKQNGTSPETDDAKAREALRKALESGIISPTAPAQIQPAEPTPTAPANRIAPITSLNAAGSEADDAKTREALRRALESGTNSPTAPAPTQPVEPTPIAPIIKAPPPTEKGSISPPNATAAESDDTKAREALRRALESGTNSPVAPARAQLADPTPIAKSDDAKLRDALRRTLEFGTNAPIAPARIQPPEPISVAPTIKFVRPPTAPALPHLAPWQERLTLGPGDVIDISLYGQLDSVRQGVTIAPDGRINYLQARDVEASGLTVDELRTRLENILVKFHLAPRAVITPVAFHSKKYFILGNVVRPGGFPLNQPTTLVEAIATARGFVTVDQQRSSFTLADLTRAFLVRRQQNGEYAREPIDFEKLFLRGGLEENRFLAPDDYLYFPPLGLEEVYVLGEVRGTKPVPYTKGLTVLGAIAGCGGFTDGAFRQRILVIRGSLKEPQTFAIEGAAVEHLRAALETAGPQTTVVNAAGALRATIPDFALQPRDIVYVSRKPWAKAEELLEAASSDFIRAVVVTWTGRNIQPILRSRESSR